MANRLKQLWLDAIALVDRGANPEAHIVLSKRDDKEPPMQKAQYASMEECMKAEGNPAKCKELMAAMKRAELEGAHMPDQLPEDVTKALAEVADLKKRAETAETAQKAAEARIAKMEAEEAVRKAEAKVSGFKGLALEAGFGALYHKMTAPLSAEEIVVLDKVFTAAGAQAATGKLLAEVGSGRPAAGGDAYAKIQAGAAALVQKDGKLSPAEAEARFLGTPEGKKLYDEYEAERRDAARGH